MKPNKMSIVIGVVYIFLLLYYPPILNVNFLFITSFLGLMYLIIASLFGHKLVIDDFTIKLSLGLGLLIFFQTVLAIINRYNISNSVNNLILILIGFVFGAVVLKNFCLNNNIENKTLLKMIIAAAVIQSFFCILAYLDNNFQSWFINKMISYGYTDTRFSQLSAFRWYGMATQLGFAAPIVQVVMSLICLYIAYVYNKTIYYFFMALLLFSAAINARTAVFVFIIGFIILLFSILKNHMTQRRLFKITGSIIFFFIIVAVVLNFMRTYAYDNYKWLVNGLLSFIGADVDTAGVYVVGNYFTNSNNFKLPDLLSCIIGCGALPNDINIGFSTDIGFVLDIWKFGIPMSILLYFFIGKSCFRINNLFGQKDRFLCMVMIVTLFICNIKGNIISATPITSLLCVLLSGFPMYSEASIVQNEF